LADARAQWIVDGAGLIVQNRNLSPIASVIVAVFAIGNAVLGLRFAWHLLNSPAENEGPTPGPR